jgi:hypothetical protein
MKVLIIMDAISRLLFEDLTLLLMAEAAALLVVLAIHRRKLTPQSRRMVWVTLAVCALLIAIQTMTTTKREAVRQTIESLAQAVEDGNMAAIAERVHADFEHRQMDKDTFLTFVQAQLQRWDISNVGLGQFEIEVEDERANATFRCSCNVRGNNGFERGIPSMWTIELERSEDRWQMTSIVRGKIGPRGMFDFSDVGRY